MAINETEHRRLANLKALDEIIYPEIEPNLINKEMIEEAYLNDGKVGEQARLHKMEPVVYERITQLRLEFKNILRIDHLWILTNLTKLSLNRNKIEVIENIDMLVNLVDLDLSFNYIEKIANLEKLVKLEVLSLFSNLIEKIENMDTLEKLIIFSIGNNQIATVEGIERFRFLPELRVLNFEGNPIAQNPEAPMKPYIAALLPQVRYYEYVLIQDTEREEGKEKYARELREIEANEELEIQERTRRAKEEFDAERLSSSFVEHLNENQLYESLWKGDEDGRILMLIGLPAEELAEEYKTDLYEITQEIYKLGLSSFGEREEQINEFKVNLREGQEEIQAMGQNVIHAFLVRKEEFFAEAYNILRMLEKRNIDAEDEASPETIALTEQYDNLYQQWEEATNGVWQDLMSQELHLHESIEESTVNFQRVMQEMMSKFVEQAQAHFGQLRDVATHFSENIAEVVGRYISTKLALQDFEDVHPDLHFCLEDRDAVMNLVAGMKDAHTGRIDEREDRLMTRSRKFIEEMIGELNDEEMQRNRRKILEINSYLDNLTNELSGMSAKIHDELLNEEST